MTEASSRFGLSLIEHQHLSLAKSPYKSPITAFMVTQRTRTHDCRAMLRQLWERVGQP